MLLRGLLSCDVGSDASHRKSSLQKARGAKQGLSRLPLLPWSFFLQHDGEPLPVVLAEMSARGGVASSRVAMASSVIEPITLSDGDDVFSLSLVLVLRLLLLLMLHKAVLIPFVVLPALLVLQQVSPLGLEEGWRECLLPSSAGSKRRSSRFVCKTHAATCAAATDVARPALRAYLQA